jgi:hypothetical protein
MRQVAVAMLVAVAIGCGSATKKPAAPPPPPRPDAGLGGPSVFDVDESVPADLRIAIDHAQRLGRVLVAFDSAAAFATDVVRSNQGLDGVIGYLVHPRPRGALEVVFFVSAEPPLIGRRVLLSSGEKPVYERRDPAEQAPPELAALFRARQLVLASLTNIEQPLNPVVFPGIAVEEQGIVVYLLAGTTRKDTVVLGKHHRARTSTDGKQVLALEALSKAPIELPLHANVPGATSAGIVVTHLVTDYPLETHVFASLLHRVPVYVKTARGIWKVNGDRISFEPR